MVCNDVKRIAYFYLDGTLGDQKRTEVRSHLDDCPDCEGRLVIHKRLRHFLRTRCQAGAPKTLKERIQHLFRGARPDYSGT